jgi:hypothetical protein
MVNWPDLHFRARAYAATEPGFLATRFLELVNMNGGHVTFCLNLGLDLATPAGEDAANFYAALIMLCRDLCAMGVGHLPFNPAPPNVGPLGPVAAGAPVVAGAPGVVNPPPEDGDFVEIIGGVHPVHGPWVVDHDFVEIIGGVHPVHGPWVEGAPLPPDMAANQPAADIEELVDDLWNELFGDINDDQDQGNIPDN